MDGKHELEPGINQTENKESSAVSDDDGGAEKNLATERVRYSLDDLRLMIEIAMEGGETLQLGEADLRGMDLRGLVPAGAKISLRSWGRNEKGQRVAMIAQLDEDVLLDGAFVDAVVDRYVPYAIQAYRNKKNTPLATTPELAVPAPTVKVAATAEEVPDEVEPITKLAMIERDDRSELVKGYGLGLIFPDGHKAIVHLDIHHVVSQQFTYPGLASVTVRVYDEGYNRGYYSSDHPGQFQKIVVTLSAQREKINRKLVVKPFEEVDLESATTKLNSYPEADIKKIFGGSLLKEDFLRLVKSTIAEHFTEFLEDQTMRPENIDEFGTLANCYWADVLGLDEGREAASLLENTPELDPRVHFINGEMNNYFELLENGEPVGRVSLNTYANRYIRIEMSKPVKTFKRCSSIEEAEHLVNLQTRFKNIRLILPPVHVEGQVIVDGWGESVSPYKAPRALRKICEQNILKFSADYEAKRSQIMTDDPSEWTIYTKHFADGGYPVYVEKKGVGCFEVIDLEDPRVKYDPTKWPQWVVDWVTQEFGPNGSNYKPTETVDDNDGGYFGFGHPSPR